MIGWRAIDSAFGDEVVVHPLPADFLAAEEQIRWLEPAFAAASNVAHPGVVRWHSLDLDDGLAVREWVNGFTLLDLLRRHRKLSVLEALTLLEGLPDLLDWLSPRGIIPVGDLLEEGWIAFPREVATAELLELPLSEWPPHRIKLALLHPRHFWDQYGEKSSEATLRSDAPSSASPVRLARLFRELLGDRVRRKPWRPMSSLSEEANQLLIDTLDGAAWQCTRDFWTAIVAAAAEGALEAPRSKTHSTPLGFSIPPSFEPLKYRVAILEPQQQADPPIQLCAGTDFRFGRDESLVDFRTVLWPDTSENKSVSVKISRAHARIEIRDGALWVCDGDGQSASRNGTRWNGATLPAMGTTRMYGRGVLHLANQYGLTLTPLPWEFTRDLTLGGIPINASDSTLPCAVLPNPIGGQRPPVRAVWILTALGFHLDPSGDIEWHDGGVSPPSGIFIRNNDGFWLANAGLPPGTIRVGEIEPRPGEAAPLVPRQSLRIGDRLYNVTMTD
jgi:hypothetical protein